MKVNKEIGSLNNDASIVELSLPEMQQVSGGWNFIKELKITKTITDVLKGKYVPSRYYW